MKNIDFVKYGNEKNLHYELVKKYFRKSATDKSRFYNLKSSEEIEREIKKRSMWKIYTSILDEILSGNDKILSAIDVACGIGNFTFELVKHNQIKKILGIDFLKETFNIARKTEKKFANITFMQGDLLNLPFFDRSFDLTVCINTLHHIHENDFSKAIGELARITNSYVMLEIRNKNYILIPFINKIVLQKLYRDLPIYSCSISEINDLMGKNRFKLKIIRGNSSLSWACWRLVLVYKRI